MTGKRPSISRFYRHLGKTGKDVSITVELNGSVFDVRPGMRDWLSKVADLLQECPSPEGDE